MEFGFTVFDGYLTDDKREELGWFAPNIVIGTMPETLVQEMIRLNVTNGRGCYERILHPYEILEDLTFDEERLAKWFSIANTAYTHPNLWSENDRNRHVMNK